VTKVPADPQGQRIRIQRPDFILIDSAWRSIPTLRLVRPGAAHSILLFWARAEFQAWYVNLERPLQRTAIGFDYLDQKLDVIVWADGRVEWKDEDELAESVERGIFSAEEARAAREEAERVLEAWPFPTGWEEWRRPPLEAPQLPAGWDTV
jgi:predicted RNA-binding protein associated with RNAse of E/G family